LDELGLADLPSAPPPDLRRRSVERLVRAWGEDPAHVGLAARLAIQLFDETRSLHDLGPAEREWLGHAAMLHEIGTAVSPARFHKHGAYLVEHAGLRGFAPSEVAMIASIVRFQRGKDPRPVYPPFAGLTEDERNACVTLTGLLRVAHAIARGPEGEQLRLAVHVRDEGVLIRVEGAADSDGTVSEAQLSAALLERSLDRVVEIVSGASTRPTGSARTAS
jgi:exopolyphosphatase/guanosine-5'-triphosphate,3'-diphosphate pyrophosphatase